jgi:hypothetical protein
VGTVGPVSGVQASDMVNYYWRGHTDPFGDEWHTIGVGDDDSWRNTTYGEVCASDGKTFHMIVNPTTPVLWFERTDSLAQYYTTPAKAYFIPKLHAQTTYFSGNVSICLKNIMTSAAVYYRFDADAFQAYSGPIGTAALSNGSHTLEYYYDTGHHKTRTMVKNPGYPSDNDQFVDGTRHGYLLWRDSTEYTRVKDRLLNGIMKPVYQTQRADNWPYAWRSADTLYHLGKRYNVGKPLADAIVVAMEGVAAAPQHARYAKMGLLDNGMYIDRQGHEMAIGMTALPSKELHYHGYYAVNPVF